jgi:hypothetical protein
VPVRGFWSVSVYNRDGYFQENEQGRYSVNSVTAVPNRDESVTINFGGEPELPNQIPIMERWKLHGTALPARARAPRRQVDIPSPRSAALTSTGGS